MALVVLRRLERLVPSEILVLLLATATVAAAQEPRTASETEIKAAYLYHFAKFVEWPADARAGESFTTCVLRDTDFATTLREQVGKKRIQDKPVEVRLLQHGRQAVGCQVLYLGDAGDGEVEPTRGTLVVADRRGVPDSALSFVVQGDNVRFVADVNAAQRSGLTLSSQLLKLAVAVTGAPGGDG